MWNTSSLTIKTCLTGQRKWYCSVLFGSNNKLSNFQVLGEANKYNPPNVFSMDHQPKCAHPNHLAPSPKIHVHFEGLGNTLQFGRSVLGNLATPTSSTPLSSPVSSSTMSSSARSSSTMSSSTRSSELSTASSSATSLPSTLLGHSPIIDPVVDNLLLQDALNSLHKVHPELNFPSMLVLLLGAGMK